MDSHLLPTVGNIEDWGEINQTVSVVDERPINLSNAAVNIANSSDVVIGNVHHHYHSPVTLHQITSNNGEIVRNRKNSINSNSAEFRDFTGLDPSNKVYITRNRIYFIFVLICVTLILLVMFLIIPVFKEGSHETLTKNKNELLKINNKEEYQGKPSISFGNLSSLNGCKIIEEEDWGIKRNLEDLILKEPVPLVIVSHSVTPFCYSFEQCKARIAQIQEFHISQGSPDIGYNFIIGGDANIYVGRGWKARNFHHGNHSIALNFIGNFFRDKLTSGMMQCAKSLFEYGADNGHLTKDYALVCHNQTALSKGTSSPGPNICGEIKKWPHYLSGSLDWNYLYGV